MSRNMSTLDRRLRSFVVAPAAIILAVVVGAGSIGGITLFALAAGMLATGAAGFCPMYTLFHIDTRGRTPLPH
jgi:Inner membrane protein YgaP-like, transmembrane domain